jgi:hypothetical protein
MINVHESSVLTYSNKESVAARAEIFQMLKNYPASDEECERNMALFLKSSLLARILAINDLYREIVGLPGSIMDLGTWRGQTAVLCENLRAIHEPLNFTRRLICFDTFSGYLGFGVEDRESLWHREGTYSLSGEHSRSFLANLLNLHEKSNAMGHNFGKHTVIAGDVREKLPEFFSDNPNEFLSLIFFDLNVFQPTKNAFELVWPRLVPGGIVCFWQLTRSSVPAEGKYYAETILPSISHSIQQSRVYPGLSYIRKPLI